MRVKGGEQFISSNMLINVAVQSIVRNKLRRKSGHAEPFCSQIKQLKKTTKNYNKVVICINLFKTQILMEIHSIRLILAN